MIPCVWRKYLGVECMGCGFQRSISLLWEGELFQSIAMFPAGIPMLLTLAFLVYHLMFKPVYGAKTLTVLFITTAFIMVTHFILRMIMQY
jgi:hypothetical protein